MKNFSRFFALATVVASVSLISCSDDDDGVSSKVVFDEGDLPTEITSDLSLYPDETYRFNGGIHVKSGATLRIFPGVTLEAINDDLFDYIVIEPGATLDAIGTSALPIVMTLEEDNDDGAYWGGIHICGNAIVNGESLKSECGSVTYGGEDNTDNSGSLMYTRIEGVGGGNNGITLYGVGSGTVISHCQAYMADGDGIEVIGGAVDVLYCIAVDCTDDAFKFTNGWVGTASHLFALQSGKYGGDRLIVCENNSSDNNLTPVSRPVIANSTLIGYESDDMDTGIYLGEGTQVEIYSSVVMGKSNSLAVQSLNTHCSLSGVWTTSSLSTEYRLSSYMEALVLEGSYNQIRTNSDGSEVPSTNRYSIDPTLVFAKGDLTFTEMAYTSETVTAAAAAMTDTTMSENVTLAAYVGAFNSDTSDTPNGSYQWVVDVEWCIIPAGYTSL